MHKIKDMTEFYALLGQVSKKSLESNSKRYTLKEDDMRKNFKSRFNQEMKDLLGEQDEAEEPAIEDEEEQIPPGKADPSAEGEGEGEGGGEEVPEPEAPSEEEPTVSKNPAAEKAKSYDDYDDEFEASFESIKDAINILRAGKSLKNKEISQELNDYYDILDENERGVLLLFLRELSKIITGAIDGDEGHDPSDAKTYFDISKRNEEESTSDNKKSIDMSKEKKRDSSSPEIMMQRSKPKPAEDTSPPIKVNESQDFSNINKILG